MSEVIRDPYSASGSCAPSRFGSAKLCAPVRSKLRLRACQPAMSRIGTQSRTKPDVRDRMPIWTSRSGCEYGSGRRSTVFTTLKIALAAPIPSVRHQRRQCEARIAHQTAERVPHVHSSIMDISCSPCARAASFMPAIRSRPFANSPNPRRCSPRGRPIRHAPRVPRLPSPPGPSTRRASRSAQSSSTAINRGVPASHQG